MTFVPRQLSGSERAAQQEREALAGIESQERLIKLGQAYIAPPGHRPEGLVDPAPPDLPPAPVDSDTPAPPPGLDLEALRASGMDEGEIAAMVAEWEGRPVPPPSSPAEAVLRQVEGVAAVGPAMGPPFQLVPAMRITITPRPMSDDEHLAAVKAVRLARDRLSLAEQSLEQAQAERASAVDALEAARRTVAEGVAALMT